jgi:uncharacterized Fe-S cluster-containing radical SAM superfamily protein
VTPRRFICIHQRNEGIDSSRGKKYKKKGNEESIGGGETEQSKGTRMNCASANRWSKNKREERNTDLLETRCRQARHMNTN